MSIAEKLQTIAENEQKVYDAGKQAEYEYFWESHLASLLKYSERFHTCRNAYSGAGWIKYNFKPTEDIVVVGNATRMFQYHSYWRSSYDLAEHLEKLGVRLDTSLATVCTGLIHTTGFTRVPVLDLSSATDITDMCSNSTLLRTIDGMIFSESVTPASNSGTFYRCSALANIRLEGVCSCSLYLTYSPLTVESMISIITHLKDFTGTGNENTKSLKFSSECWSALNEAETPPDGYADWQDYVTQGLKWLV